MSQQFKLPCPACQQPFIVSPTEAGETRICPCGEKTVVPTLRAIRQLEPIESESSSSGPTRGWNAMRGTLFVAGILLLAIGAYGHFRMAPLRQDLNTEQPDFEELSIDVQTLTPMQAWEAWDHFRRQSLQYRDTPEFLADRERFEELSFYLYLFWGSALIGIGLVITSLLLRGQAERS